MELLEVEMAVAVRDSNARATEAEKGEKLIRFAIGDRPFCVKAAAVAEIITPLNPSPVPNSPEWLLGLAGCRGDLVAVLDPSLLSKGARHTLSDRSRTIVFHGVAGSIKIALPVESVSDLVELNLIPVSIGTGDAELVRTVSLPDGEAGLVEPGSLLNFLSPRST